MKRLLATLLLPVVTAQAKIMTESVAYKDGDVVLEGYLAYDDARPGPRPAVVVVHEWWGLNDFVKERARALAELGYVAFAIDMYGQGKVTDDPAEAARLAGQFRDDPAGLRRRAQAGLDVLARHERVDPKRIAAIGFCFGGTTVLQMAYAGLDLAGVVSFHGNPVPPLPEEAKRIKARILVLHGAADTHVTPEQLAAFQRAVEEARVDWELVIYAGAKHAFMNPAADKLGMPGVGYQRRAAQRAWLQMQVFFDELFGQSS
jgi:dienelactone hydrolase